MFYTIRMSFDVHFAVARVVEECYVSVVLFMAALWNRADHYIFILFFLLSCFFFSYFLG